MDLSPSLSHYHWRCHLCHFFVMCKWWTKAICCVFLSFVNIRICHTPVMRGRERESVVSNMQQHGNRQLTRSACNQLLLTGWQEKQAGNETDKNANAQKGKTHVNIVNHTFEFIFKGKMSRRVWKLKDIKGKENFQSKKHNKCTFTQPSNRLIKWTITSRWIRDGCK